MQVFLKLGIAIIKLYTMQEFRFARQADYGATAVAPYETLKNAIASADLNS